MQRKKRRFERREVENGEKREGGVGEASVFLVNKMRRKWLFYTQVRSYGRIVPVCVSETQREKG